MLPPLCRPLDYADVGPEGAGGGGAGGDEVGIITALRDGEQAVGCTAIASVGVRGRDADQVPLFAREVGIAGRSGWLVLDGPVARRRRRILRDRD